MAEDNKVTKAVTYATFWQRLAAAFVDGIILSLAGQIWRSMFGNNLYQAVSLATGALYSILFWLKWDGQTIGKRLLKIKIVTIGLRPLDVRTAVLRYLGYLVSVLPFLAGYIWMLWDGKKQTWHDKIGKTVVIKA